jgi:PhoD-like phosphatase
MNLFSLYHPFIFCCSDHDFGCDNGDSTNIHRKESGIAFVDFIGLPNDSLTRIRAQKGLGVYGVKLFDFGIDGDDSIVTKYDIPDVVAGIDADINLDGSAINEKKYSNRSVAVFVLDVRTNKSPWKQDVIGRFSADMDGDFLGKEQWEWFTKSLRRSKASVNIIVGGLQFHGTRAPDVNIAEAWGNYPRMQQKLYDLLLEENVQSPILISGDVHMTQLSRKDCVPRQMTKDVTDNLVRRHRRSLIELTTSGMTHSWGTLSEKHNGDVSESWPLLQMFRNGQNWARMKAVATYVHLLHRFCPWTDIVVAGNNNNIVAATHRSNDMNGIGLTGSSGATTSTTTTVSSSTLYENGGGENSFAQGMQYSLEMNFGELEFDWIHRTVAIRSIGHIDEKDGVVEKPLIMARYSMDELSGRDEISNHYPKLDGDFVFEEKRQVRSNIDGEWVCVNHRGRGTNVEHFVGHVAAGSVLVTLFLSPVCITMLLLYVVKKKVCATKRARNNYWIR